MKKLPPSTNSLITKPPTRVAVQFCIFTCYLPAKTCTKYTICSKL